MAGGFRLELTNGETLQLWRRRHDLTQEQAAEKIKANIDRYREWEANRGLYVPRKNLGEVKTHEYCYILRRRSGLSQRELAHKMGVTRLWVIQMEGGSAPVERLKHYWKEATKS